nr:glycosyltransferase family 4 protein [uncultured Flavobacterium sp.]
MALTQKLIRITTVPISLEKLLDGQLSYMRNYFDITAISSDKEALDKIGTKNNIAVYEIEMTRKITPVKDLMAVFKLFLFLRKTKPFIVHTHTPKAGTVGMIASKLASVPHRLHTIAGLPLLEATGNKRKLLNFVEKVTYACATKIYPNSNGLKDIIIQQEFCLPNKLKVIASGSSNGINTNHFNPDLYSMTEIQNLKTNLGITPDDFVFIFVGRLVGDKGINEIVESFKKLSSENNTIKLLLVGPLESDLDPLSVEALYEIESNKNIISVGYQNDVRPYFSISDILVFPSYREGFPNVVMQAGAMGLPCIVSNINGCNEIIIENENGVIIPVKEADAIYKAMYKMVSDVIFRTHLSKNARPLIESRYEQKVVWEAILKEYKSLK